MLFDIKEVDKKFYRERFITPKCPGQLFFLYPNRFHQTLSVISL